MNFSTEQKIIGGVGLLTLALLIGGVWFFSAQDADQQTKLSKSLLGEEIPIQNSSHVNRNEDHIPYSTNPPTSGPHFGDGVAGAGIHKEEVSDELLVHSLEHGAVIVSYKPNLSQEDIDKIKEAFNSASGKKIMVPRKNLDVPVALTSWGRLLKLETIDTEKIKAFIETNNDRAPEKAHI